jgi:formate--tetrahydrofolate ligase
MTDIEIARSYKPLPLQEIAKRIGLSPDELYPHGRYKGKVALVALDRLKGKPQGRYILVTAINPTPLGEGKTTTSIGLAMGLCRLGQRALVTLRQPSLGPVFGVKGGGTGGGHAQVVPMEEINLHFTGDAHARSQPATICSQPSSTITCFTETL